MRPSTWTCPMSIVAHHWYNVFNTMTVDQRGPDPCHTKMLNNIYQSSMDMVTWSIWQIFSPTSLFCLHAFDRLHRGSSQHHYNWVIILAPHSSRLGLFHIPHHVQAGFQLAILCIFSLANKSQYPLFFLLFYYIMTKQNQKRGKTKCREIYISATNTLRDFVYKNTTQHFFSSYR